DPDRVDPSDQDDPQVADVLGPGRDASHGQEVDGPAVGRGHLRVEPGVQTEPVTLGTLDHDLTRVTQVERSVLRQVRLERRQRRDRVSPAHNPIGPSASDALAGRADGVHQAEQVLGLAVAWGQDRRARVDRQPTVDPVSRLDRLIHLREQDLGIDLGTGRDVQLTGRAGHGSNRQGTELEDPALRVINRVTGVRTGDPDRDVRLVGLTLAQPTADSALAFAAELCSGDDGDGCHVPSSGWMRPDSPAAAGILYPGACPAVKTRDRVPAMIPRYSHPLVDEQYSSTQTYSDWLTIELATLIAQVNQGAIPDTSVTQLLVQDVQELQIDDATASIIAGYENRTHHDVGGFLAW